jgi:hypothetical protein
MKTVLIIIVIGMCYSCSVSRKVAQSYYYVEPFKEQEIKLFLKIDSTFSFQDLTGCNQFEFTGRYKQVSDNGFNCLVFDSVKLQNVLSNFNSDLIFSIKNRDTAWIINSERVFIHKQPFIAVSNNNINLQKIRYEKLEEYYTGLLGREGFIKVFGNGKGKKEAKKRLLECTLPDIKIN